MSAIRSEALMAARKRLRTFGSAPDPKKQARELYSELFRADGWTPRERDAIDTWRDAHEPLTNRRVWRKLGADRTRGSTIDRPGHRPHLAACVFTTGRPAPGA